MSGLPRHLGLAAAAIMLALDQASKLWLLLAFDLAQRQPVKLLPFFDLVLAWNTGISYSLFSGDSATGRWVLIAVTLTATIGLGIWLWTARHALTALALGLLVGGALGNLIDRLAYGAVVDFAHFHVGGFSWYVFNFADCGIVVGVALLLYDNFTKGDEKAISPPA